MEVLNEELTALRQAYEQHPEDRETALHLAQQYSDIGWYNEALAVYQSALEIAPEDPNLVLEYGNTAFRKGDFKSAITLFEKLTVIRPERIEGWNNLGIARSEVGDHDGAHDAFQKVLDLEPDNPGALLNMGNYLYEKKKFDEAKNYFERACKARIDFPDAWFNLGNVLIELEDYGAARKAFEKAIRYRREFPSALKNLGWIHEREQRFAEAKECYTEALLGSKADARLHVNLGNVNIRLKKYDEAKSCFLKAVRLAPNDIHGWMGLRGYALAKGDVATFMRATMAVLPRLSEETLAQSIEVLYELNQFDKAEDLLSQADRLGRGGDLIDCMRLLLYRKNGEHEEVLPELVRRLSALDDPQDAVLKGLARYHLVCGDYDTAARVIGRMDMPDVSAKAILWRAMIGLGTVTEAKREIREFMAQHPENYDTCFLLAAIEAQRGNERRAEVLLVHALDRGFSNMEELHAHPGLHSIFETMTGRKLVEDAQD